MQFAHGLVQRANLPIPEWLFGWAAAIVLLVSFVALAVLWPEPKLTRDRGGDAERDRDSGSVTFTHTGDSLGAAGSFGFKANDGAADSNTATANLVTVARSGGRCFNPFVGTGEKDLIVGSRFGDRIGAARASDTVRARECRLRQWQPGRRPPARRAWPRSPARQHRGRPAFGGPAHDRLVGARGNYGLAGRSGRDRLSGGRGPDRLNGGGGNDRLNTRGGTNRLNGGAGNDRLFSRNGPEDKVRCGRGTDRVRADAEDNVAADCKVVNGG